MEGKRKSFTDLCDLWVWYFVHLQIYLSGVNFLTCGSVRGISMRRFYVYLLSYSQPDMVLCQFIFHIFFSFCLPTVFSFDPKHPEMATRSSVVWWNASTQNTKSGGSPAHLKCWCIVCISKWANTSRQTPLPLWPISQWSISVITHSSVPSAARPLQRFITINIWPGIGFTYINILHAIGFLIEFVLWIVFK